MNRRIYWYAFRYPFSWRLSREQPRRGQRDSLRRRSEAAQGWHWHWDCYESLDNGPETRMRVERMLKRADKKKLRLDTGAFFFACRASDMIGIL